MLSRAVVVELAGEENHYGVVAILGRVAAGRQPIDHRDRIFAAWHVPARLADRRMLRQFAVVIGSPAGPQVADSFDIADSDTTFWRFAASSKTTAGRLNEGLREFLTRAILRQAALSRPKDVASFLASYARDAKARVDASTLPALRDIKSVLGQALGLEFKGDAGDRFFKSTLVQTLF